MRDYVSKKAHFYLKKKKAFNNKLHYSIFSSYDLTMMFILHTFKNNCKCWCLLKMNSSSCFYQDNLWHLFSLHLHLDYLFVLGTLVLTLFVAELPFAAIIQFCLRTYRVKGISVESFLNLKYYISEVEMFCISLCFNDYFVFHNFAFVCDKKPCANIFVDFGWKNLL